MDINASLAYIPMMTKLIMMDINVRRWMMKCLRWVRFVRVCLGGIVGVPFFFINLMGSGSSLSLSDQKKKQLRFQ